MKNKKDYIISSGNIFADLGFPDAEEKLAKVNLAYQINTIIKQKKLTQVQAATLLDIDQPKISALSKGKLAGFSLERLFRFLTILGQDITIKVAPKAKSKQEAHVRVSLPRVISKQEPHVEIIPKKIKKKTIITPRTVIVERPSIQAKKKK